MLYRLIGLIADFVTENALNSEAMAETMRKAMRQAITTIRWWAYVFKHKSPIGALRRLLART
ncbi:hypothetical protein C1H69_17095 [Billgrantia endophytica]|uniref:Uncharacterized protein n=1 Tax=Billgrantia endophytica TaxID=2033802 RepID=A0A2N7TZD5_9GAMM|nr:hypothetical protein C1H69_17095 [Halomonas endophytica]